MLYPILLLVLLAVGIYCETGKDMLHISIKSNPRPQEGYFYDYHSGKFGANLGRCHPGE